jgi:hypothetical protein
MNMKFVCTDPVASGEGRVNFKGDSAYDMKMTMNTTHQGKPVATTMDASGKWLGARTAARSSRWRCPKNRQRPRTFQAARARPPKIAVPTRTRVLPA